MKKVASILSLCLIIIAFLVAVPYASARVISSETTANVAADEVIDDDLFITSGTVTIEGTVNGDVYAAGGVVTINGTVNGDVLAAGGMVDISGDIADDVRVAGGNISIRSATIGDSLNTFGGTILVDSGTRVNGGYVMAGGVVNSDANITRGILGGAGRAVINGEVGGNVQVGVEELVFGQNANIQGSVEYTSQNTATIDDRATLASDPVRTSPREADFGQEVDISIPGPVLGAVGLGFQTWSYLSALVIGVLLLALFNKPTIHIVERIEQRPWQQLGWGLLLFLVFVPLIIMLMVTLIGIPLAGILVGLFGIVLYLVKVFMGILLGRWVAEVAEFKRANKYLVFAGGLLFYYLITAVPFANLFVWLFATMVVLGSLFTGTREYVQSSR